MHTILERFNNRLQGKPNLFLLSQHLFIVNMNRIFQLIELSYQKKNKKCGVMLAYEVSSSETNEAKKEKEL